MKGDFSRLTFNKLKHFASVLSQQGRVLLDSEQNEAEAIEAHLHETSLTDIIGPSGVPLNDPNAFQIAGVTASDFTIAPGHMYVDGILVENDSNTATTFSAQPYLRAVNETVSPPGGAIARTDLVYLEVWQQHVTALEDPDIREKALNIPDTTTRLRTLWRVHLQPGVGSVDCDDAITNFPPPPTALRLTNSVSLAAQSSDPCVIAPDGGFRLLENRLMRVEIHNGSVNPEDGSPSTPTAKWSAENAAVVYAISSINPVTIVISGSSKPGLRLTLKQQARDQFLSLGVNDLVEIVSGADEIRGKPGVLGTVHERISETVYNVLLNTGEVVPAAYTATPLPASLYNPALTDFKVRRWDGLIPDLTVASDLGNTGVSISFPTVGLAHSGDYWVFAGRTANVADANDSIEKLTNAAPHGVRRHYARLGLIQWAGNTPTVVDCRAKFPPLTNMIELHYVSGDGQEILSNGTTVSTAQPLKPLIVRVSNGGIPLKNIEVSFVPAAGSGTVTPASPLRTDANGLASVNWTLNPTTYRQQVTASLVANPNLKVIFNANLSVAEQVGYSPKDPDCYDPHVDNVKDALDQLCARGETDEDGIHIKEVLWQVDRKHAENNTEVLLSRLLGGLIVATDHEIADKSISRATCYVVMEIPMEAADPISWLSPVVLRAEEGASANEIRWKPSPLPASMRRALAGLNGPDRDRGLLARFYLKGNFIRDKESKLYLDGEDFGVPNGAAPFNLLPLDAGNLSGNKRRGGDFYMWFWVIPDKNDILPGKIGFMVAIGELAGQVFGANLSQIALYSAILDDGIDRAKLDPGLLPAGYQPLPKPYDPVAVRQKWDTLPQSKNRLKSGLVQVFTPESLRPLGDALCEMWQQINPELHYQTRPVADDEFVDKVVEIMKMEAAAGNGFSLIALSSEDIAQALATQHPQDFDFAQFKPI